MKDQKQFGIHFQVVRLKTRRKYAELTAYMFIKQTCNQPCGVYKTPIIVV